MPNSLTRLLATFFYIGFLPVAPGTIASVFGVLFFILLRPSPLLYGAGIVLVAAAGFLVAGKMEELANEPDADCIVIDEVAGMMLAFYLLPVTTLTPAVVLTTFFLFHAFDMFKIYPTQKFEPLPGVGVMADDLIAGLYTNLTMQAALRLVHII